MIQIQLNVYPRYTSGSPGMVDEVLAQRIGEEEKENYEYAIEGFLGDEQKERAELLGLRSIAEEWIEYRNRWEIEDLITGDKYTRPFKKFKMGNRKFEVRQELEYYDRNERGVVQGYLKLKVLGKVDERMLLVQWEHNEKIEELKPSDKNLLEAA